MGMGNANSLVQDLNSVRHIHFLRREQLYHKDFEMKYNCMQIISIR